MSKYLLAASTFALFASPANALTAPELWADWQETYTGMGSTLSAESEDYANGTLVLRGMTQASNMFGTVGETTYGDITLIEQSDGSVRIEVPSEITQTTSVEVNGQTVETSILVTVEGLDAVARDDGETRIYDISASALSYSIDDVSGGEEENPVTFTFAFVDYDSTTSFTGETYDATGTMGVTLAAQGTGDEPFEMNYAAEGMDITMTGTLPNVPEGTEISSLADMDLSYDLAMTHSGSTMSVNAVGPEGPFAYEGTAGGGGLSAALSPDAISYGLSSTEVSMTVTPPALPLPIAASASEMAMSLGMPLAEGEEGPFNLSVSMQDVAIDDTLWGLFDPTGQLPRDPATIELETSGEAMVLANFMEQDAVAMMDGPPFLPTALDLTTLLVSVAGAELRGSGAVEWASIMANPIPVGEVTLELDGGFALLDKLVALGFVPAGQVAMVRGMAGAVATPVGDDQLRSEIEFTEGGILANGLPLPF